MSNYPLSRATNYVPGGGGPPVSAQDLLDLQDSCVRTHRDLRGGNLLIADDFISSTLNTSIWGTATSGTGSSPAAINDPSIGTYTQTAGVLHLTAGGGSGSALLATPLKVGVGRFKFYQSFYVRLTDAGATDGTVALGLSDSLFVSPTNYAFFKWAAGSNWHFFTTGGTNVDTGINPVTSTGYHLLEAYRDATDTFHVLADGVEVGTANTIATLAQVQFGNFLSVGATDTAHAYVDLAKLEVERFPV